MKKLLDVIYNFRGWIFFNLVILFGVLVGMFFCIKFKNNYKKEIDLLKITEYTAKYMLKVNSNKTQNTYVGEEIVKENIRINKFKDKLDNEVEITKTDKEIKIIAKGQKYVYTIDNKKYKYNDFSLIDFIAKYKEYIGKSYEENNHIIYEVSKDENTAKLILNKETKRPIALINIDKTGKITSKLDYLKLDIKE